LAVTARQLRKYRLAAGLSQAEVADRLKVTQATVSCWEMGKAVPTDAQISEIQEFLGDIRSEAGASSRPEPTRAGAESFSGWLVRARADSRLSVPELHRRSGVSDQAIRGIEAGRIAKPRFATRDALSRVLSAPVVTQRDTEAEMTAGTADGLSPYAVWLNRTRTKRGLTVVELARQAGITHQAIYGIEAGRIDNPRDSTRTALSRALKEEVPDDTLRETRKAASVTGLGSLEDFNPHDENDLPAEPGVYVFYDVSQRPIYVGEAGNISKRVRDHKEKFWFKMPIVDTASYIKIPDERLRRQVEQILIRFLKSNAVLNKKHVDRD